MLKSQIANQYLVAGTPQVSAYNDALSQYNDYVKNVVSQHPEITDINQGFNIPEVNSAYQALLPKYQAAQQAAGGDSGNIQAPGDYSIAGTKGGQSGWAKILKQVAPALAASFIAPGLGGLLASGLGVAAGAGTSALGGALLGGGINGAMGQNPLLGALEGGIGGYASGGGFGDIAGGIKDTFGDIQSGLGIPDLGGSSPANLAGAPNGALSALGGSPNADILGSLHSSIADLGNASYAPTGLNALAGLGSAAPAVSAASAAGDAGSGLLSGLLKKVESKPLEAIGTLLTVGNALQGSKVEGTQSQSDVLAQQQADKAKQAQFSADTVRMLNSASSGRSPVNPSISDYYTYGSRPEATFFNKVNTPITY